MRPETWLQPNLVQAAYRARQRKARGAATEEDKRLIAEYDELVAQRRRRDAAPIDVTPERPPVVLSLLPAPSSSPPPPSSPPPTSAEPPQKSEPPIVEAEPMDEPSSSSPPPPPPMPDPPSAPSSGDVATAEGWALILTGVLKELGAQARAKGNLHIPDVFIDGVVLKCTKNVILELGVSAPPPWANKAVVVGACVLQVVAARMPPRDELAAAPSVAPGGGAAHPHEAPPSPPPARARNVDIPEFE
ncbi:MAG TPA: hypothetical protein VK510_03170 [Solirubrobacteraceae bacterium]|nr:hypothetical protein [Solirubrobacteraceae bacterium]